MPRVRSPAIHLVALTGILLVSWVTPGPAGADDRASRRAPHWAYAPLRPDDRDVDAFISERLTKEGLRTSPAADRRTLIRRSTFDLIGLPPSDSEIREFLEDDHPDAYEKLVDRLLASPRYGERQARHWMDLVHFAETHGHDQDRPRMNAWPYRDYLVESFNDDKPYARFAEEQIAGDVLYPDDPAAHVATGFLAAGPWDESSLRDIVQGTLDSLKAQYLDRDDMITTTLSTFTSTTAHCARCHRHKFDPISQKDYYALQAIFAGVDRAARAYDPDPVAHRRRRELLTGRARLDSGQLGPKELLSAEVAAQVDTWEKRAGAPSTPWTVLHARDVHSSGGATGTRRSDGSIIFSGKNPGTDTYTIIAETDLELISAVRLEVLPHPTLPQQGPGRCHNGNLHLSEIHLDVAPRGKSGGTDSKSTRVRLVRPQADFDQTGWTITHALDGNPKTAWGIYPKVGQRHFAVFELAEPVRLDGGAVLTFTLEQLHGGSHLIGRPRLSVTSSRAPLVLSNIPDAITKIRTKAKARRTESERTELARYVVRTELQAAIDALPAVSYVYAGVNQFPPDGKFQPHPGPKPINVLRRGEIERPGPEAKPAVLRLIDDLRAKDELSTEPDEGQRRAELARWITDERNGLTWRSIVNRAWQHHFTRGIVDTPNDFGRAGSRPSHPELLDALAARFLTRGGSLKDLHRELTTSTTYRQRSDTRDEAAERVDADSHLLWRMPRRRLEAECVRDAVLVLSGKFDAKMGGPSVKQFHQKPGIHVTPTLDYTGFDVDRPELRRRSTYRFLFRTLPDPFLATLDCADGSQLTPKRTESVTALQALALLNNRFVVRYAEHFADRVTKLESTPDAQIRRAFSLALSRQPSKEELAVLREHRDAHGFASTCRLIVNLNEFVFVD